MKKIMGIAVMLVGVQAVAVVNLHMQVYGDQARALYENLKGDEVKEQTKNKTVKAFKIGKNVLCLKQTLEAHSSPIYFCSSGFDSSGLSEDLKPTEKQLL